MIKQVVLPKLGENIEAGDVLSFRVKVGDIVRQDEELFEVDTDKATVPVPSPCAGKVIKIHIVAGQTVKIDDVLCEIDESTAAVADNTTVNAGPALVSEAGKPSAHSQPEKRPVAASSGQGSYTGGVQSLVRRERMSRIRQTISENIRLSYSTIPQATNFDDADVTELEVQRVQLGREYGEVGVRLTLTPFIIRALATALSSHPDLNASVSSDGLEILYKENVNIGVAVESERGLVVPVLTNAERKDVLTIARELNELVERIRANRFAIEDTRDGTFTLSNLGAIGGTYATPVINPPESGILLTGKAQIAAKYIDGAFQPRRMMPLSLSYDHRIVDGAAAARFLNDFKSYLENPSGLLVSPA